MSAKNILTKSALSETLESTNFEWLGEVYRGKVRDSYTVNNKRVLIATDRLSCFDKVITSVPYKGQVLTKLAAYWFDKTAKIFPNHVISMPDPNVIIGKEVKIVPVEVVVRGYLAGSALKDYQQGSRLISGVQIPDGLKDFSKLPNAIVTPSTKAPSGAHDEPTTDQEILASGAVSKSHWNEIKDIALKLFEFGRVELEKRGIIFVDTKYEFGLLDNKVVLADEIHTLDSSRFWKADSYEVRINRGEMPEMMDKQPARQWLLERGFNGEGVIPEIPDQYRLELAQHYMQAFELLTGEDFIPVQGDAKARIEKNLRSCNILSH